MHVPRSFGSSPPPHWPQLIATPTVDIETPRTKLQSLIFFVHNHHQSHLSNHQAGYDGDNKRPPWRQRVQQSSPSSLSQPIQSYSQATAFASHLLSLVQISQHSFLKSTASRREDHTPNATIMYTSSACLLTRLCSARMGRR